MANNILEITLEWQETPTACDPCKSCGEIIYGKQFQLFLTPGGPTDVRLCESCYMVIKED